MAFGDIPSRLELLPAELRNYIYFLAVVSDAPLGVPWTCSSLLMPFGRQPYLSMTNRTIRAEVLPIFYSDNIFVAGAHSTSPALHTRLGSWTRRIQTHLRHIRSIGVFAMKHGTGEIDYSLALRNEHDQVRHEFRGAIQNQGRCTCSLLDKIAQLSSARLTTGSWVEEIIIALNADYLNRTPRGDAAHHSTCSRYAAAVA